MSDDEIEAVKLAVSEGIRDVLTDEAAVAAFWSAAFKQLQSQAQQQTGKVLLGGLATITKRIALFLALGLIVYSLGGWAAVAKLWHALTVT